MYMYSSRCFQEEVIRKMICNLFGPIAAPVIGDDVADDVVLPLQLYSIVTELLVHVKSSTKSPLCTCMIQTKMWPMMPVCKCSCGKATASIAVYCCARCIDQSGSQQGEPGVQRQVSLGFLRRQGPSSRHSCVVPAEERLLDEAAIALQLHVRAQILSLHG